MSDIDPLVVEDWSAYGKSMLDVLREERRTRPSPRRSTARVAGGSCGRLSRAKRSSRCPRIVDRNSAPQAVVLALSREQPGQVPPSTANEHEASSAEATPQSSSRSPIRAAVRAGAKACRDGSRAGPCVARRCIRFVNTTRPSRGIVVAHPAVSFVPRRCGRGWHSSARQAGPPGEPCNQGGRRAEAARSKEFKRSRQRSRRVRQGPAEG